MSLKLLKIFFFTPYLTPLPLLFIRTQGSFVFFLFWTRQISALIDNWIILWYETKHLNHLNHLNHFKPFETFETFEPLNVYKIILLNLQVLRLPLMRSSLDLWRPNFPTCSLCWKIFLPTWLGTASKYV